MHRPVLVTENVRREFRRRKRGVFVAVEDVSLAIHAGEIHGLLGPNGAGKTTFVKICATALLPTGGSILVGGIDAVAQPKVARARLGLLLGGELGFYPRASARDNLRFFADVTGISARDRNREVARVLELVALADRAEDAVRTYSRGMRQRLHLARALLGNPPLLLLDEPTTGLDPEIALETRTIIRHLAETGTGILLTSHLLAEVEDLAHTISVLGAGRIHVRGTAADIATAADLAAVTRFTLPAPLLHVATDLATRLGEDATVDTTAEQGRWRVTINWHRDPAGHLATVTNLLPADEPVETRAPTLEASYLALAERLTR